MIFIIISIFILLTVLIYAIKINKKNTFTVITPKDQPIIHLEDNVLTNDEAKKEDLITYDNNYFYDMYGTDLKLKPTRRFI